MEDYHTYSQNIRPLLSEGNRMKQVEFSKHVRKRWGLPPGTKILWTMRYGHEILFIPPVLLLNVTKTITPQRREVVLRIGSQDICQGMRESGYTQTDLLMPAQVAHH